MKLTQKVVDVLALPAGKADKIYWDEKLAGFGFRIRLLAGGKEGRTWVCQYRNKAGATRRLLLGSAPPLKAEAARDMATKALGSVARGEDPQADERDRRGKDTFKAAVTKYVAFKQRELRPRSHYELTRYLTGGFFRPLHGMALDQIIRKHVADCLTDIELECGPITAGRARAMLSAFFRWALGSGLCEINPVVGTLKPADSQARERVLDDAELAAIWKACGDDDYGRCMPARQRQDHDDRHDDPGRDRHCRRRIGMVAERGGAA
jgi:hypothetical protein